MTMKGSGRGVLQGMTKIDKMTDRETAQEGVRALLRLSVEDPSREGLEDPLADRFLGLVRQS